MADIFVSYSKPDHELARGLVLALEAEGYSVWWDASLLGGEPYRKVIMTELGKARAAIVIWTESSIHSDWVQSEAGRAHADRKLIPVKTRSLSYGDIPPPFDNMHIENLDERDKVLAAVIAQLAKPEVRTSSFTRWSARTRSEFLSWFGIVGTVITLTTNLKGVMTLADWMHSFLDEWDRYTHAFWSWALFFLPKVPKADAVFLTFFAFVGATFIASVRREPSRKLSLWSRAGIYVLAWIAIVISIGIISQRLPDTSDSYYGHLVLDAFNFLKDRLGIDLASTMQSALGIFEDRNVGAGVKLATAFWMFLLATVLFLTPVLPLMGTVMVIGWWTGRTPSLTKFTMRLWRILFGVGLLAGFNYVYLRIGELPVDGVFRPAN